MPRRRIAIALALLALGVLAAPAHASYHLMKITEVHPDPAGDGAFVELQMYAAGENFVGGKLIGYYALSGANSPATSFDHDVANGQNQRTILVGDTGVAGADFTDPSLNTYFDGAGGAICYYDPVPGSEIDCVAWGPFTNMSGSAVGTPAPAIPAGQSLTRSIAGGCPTLLEPSDDTDDSAADFDLAAPTPRPNSVAPTEKQCDTEPPETEITKAPKRKLFKSRAKFKFRSSEPRSSFECKLDRGTFEGCESPEKVKGLELGKHKFRVRAIDSEGNVDPTPAAAKFKVKRKR